MNHEISETGGSAHGPRSDDPQVADYLGCNRDVYTRYEKGVRQLPISIAIRLAELYQVSLDYLVGISDEKRPYGS